MTLAPTSSTHTVDGRATTRVGWRFRAGFASLAVSVAGWSGWISWRVTHLELHVVPVVALVLEIAGVAIGAVVALAFALADEPRRHLAEQHADDDRAIEPPIRVRRGRHRRSHPRRRPAPRRPDGRARRSPLDAPASRGLRDGSGRRSTAPARLALVVTTIGGCCSVWPRSRCRPLRSSSLAVSGIAGDVARALAPVGRPDPRRRPHPLDLLDAR